jgi:hypothetical protein
MQWRLAAVAYGYGEDASHGIQYSNILDWLIVGSRRGGVGRRCWRWHLLGIERANRRKYLEVAPGGGGLGGPHRE